MSHIHANSYQGRGLEKEFLGILAMNNYYYEIEHYSLLMYTEHYSLLMYTIAISVG